MSADRGGHSRRRAVAEPSRAPEPATPHSSPRPPPRRNSQPVGPATAAAASGPGSIGGAGPIEQAEAGQGAPDRRPACPAGGAEATLQAGGAPGAPSLGAGVAPASASAPTVRADSKGRSPASPAWRAVLRPPLQPDPPSRRRPGRSARSSATWKPRELVPSAMITPAPPRSAPRPVGVGALRGEAFGPAAAPFVACAAPGAVSAQEAPALPVPFDLAAALAAANVGPINVPPEAPVGRPGIRPFAARVGSSDGPAGPARPGRSRGRRGRVDQR